MPHRLRHGSFMASSPSPTCSNYFCQPPSLACIPLVDPLPPLICSPNGSYPSPLAGLIPHFGPSHSYSPGSIAHGAGAAANSNDCQIPVTKEGAYSLRQLSSLARIKSEVCDAQSGADGPDFVIQAGGFPFKDQASLINPRAWACSTIASSNIASQLLDDQRVASSSALQQQQTSGMAASFPFDSGFVERAARSSSLAVADYSSFSSPAMVPGETNTNNFTPTIHGFAPPHFVSSAASASMPSFYTQVAGKDISALQIASCDESGQSGLELNNTGGSIPVQICQESPSEHRSRQCVSASSSGEPVEGTFPDSHGAGGAGNAATSRRRKQLEEHTNNVRHRPPTDRGDPKLQAAFPSKKHKACLSPKVTDQSLITAGEEDKERSTASEGTSKKDTIISKERTSSEAPKQDFIHVRARRGQATDSHSLAERVRREKISERMKFLQDLVPGCSKITGKAMMLDEIINYVKSLQNQVEFLSMKLATISPSMGLGGESVQYGTRLGEPVMRPLVGCAVLDIRHMDDLTGLSDQSQHLRGREFGQNVKSAGACISELLETEIHCNSRGIPLQLQHAVETAFNAHVAYANYDQ